MRKTQVQICGRKFADELPGSQQHLDGFPIAEDAHLLVRQQIKLTRIILEQKPKAKRLRAKSLADRKNLKVRKNSTLP